MKHPILYVIQFKYIGDTEWSVYTNTYATLKQAKIGLNCKMAWDKRKNRHDVEYRLAEYRCSVADSKIWNAKVKYEQKAKGAMRPYQFSLENV